MPVTGRLIDSRAVSCLISSTWFGSCQQPAERHNVRSIACHAGQRVGLLRVGTSGVRRGAAGAAGRCRHRGLNLPGTSSRNRPRGARWAARNGCGSASRDAAPPRWSRASGARPRGARWAARKQPNDRMAAPREGGSTGRRLRGTRLRRRSHRSGARPRGARWAARTQSNDRSAGCVEMRLRPMTASRDAAPPRRSRRSGARPRGARWAARTQSNDRSAGCVETRLRPNGRFAGRGFAGGAAPRDAAPPTASPPKRRPAARSAVGGAGAIE